MKPKSFRAQNDEILTRVLLYFKKIKRFSPHWWQESNDVSVLECLKTFV